MKTKLQFLKDFKVMILGLIITSNFALVEAQDTYSVSGKLADFNTKEALMFANVAILDSIGGTLIAGSMSDDNGHFMVNCHYRGVFLMLISAVGYETVYKTIDLNSNQNLHFGIVWVYNKNIDLQDVLVVAERIKVNSDAEKTTYMVNSKMTAVSSTGSDILKLIPGIKIDLMQNISLEGNSNIIILVNGKERDKSFINQINAKQIDKVEVITSPLVKYDSQAAGAINIILVKGYDVGVDGFIHVEAPTSDQEIYLFPSYSLNYGFGKLNLFTSYNGELSYFDIVESYTRKLINQPNIKTIHSKQDIRQKNWSHRFHYGFDFFINDKNQLNYYGFYNPWSRELDGVSLVTNNGLQDDAWSAKKDDHDKNQSSYHSLYFKHVFSQKSEHSVEIDLNYYNYSADNTIKYIDNKEFISIVNRSKPNVNQFGFKVDYVCKLGNRLKFNSGTRIRWQYIDNNINESFKYSDRLLAFYGMFAFQGNRINLQFGSRFEKYCPELEKVYNNSYSSILPQLLINYSLAKTHKLKFNYRASQTYPAFYQMNPDIMIEDPWTLFFGTPDLKPVTHHHYSFEHNFMFSNNYISTRLYINRNINVINPLSYINENGILETEILNLGEIQQKGIRISGALTIGKLFGFNPWINVYNLRTFLQQLIRPGLVQSKDETGVDAGFSVFASFKHGISASVILQYNSADIQIQRSTFYDALCFISLEKTFAGGIKAGVTIANPFIREFTYQGSEIGSSGFNSRSEGNIHMSAIPLIVKLTWQFNSGEKRKSINRDREVIEQLPKKGF